jgi:hypothetical protein
MTVKSFAARCSHGLGIHSAIGLIQVARLLILVLFFVVTSASNLASQVAVIVVMRSGWLTVDVKPLISFHIISTEKRSFQGVIWVH